MREQKREYTRLWRLAFPQKEKETLRRYRLSPKGKACARRYEQTPKGRANQKRKRLSPKGRLRRKIWECSAAGLAWYRQKTARRRACKRQATVPGCEKEIAKIYARAAWWRTQGFDVAVDHIFPLGFGWHEPANLQVIYADENSKKKDLIDFRPSVIFL